MAIVSTRQAAELKIAPGYEGLLRANGLTSLESLFAFRNDDALSKPGLEPWRERLRLTLRDGQADRVFYLKRFRDPPAATRREVRRGGSGARSVAGVEWIWMQRLTTEAILCTEPVAFGEEFVGHRERRSAVLMAEAPGRSLEVQAASGEWPADIDRHALLGGLAEFIGRFHRRGYVHRDLYLSHIFLDPAADRAGWFRLIDLQRVMKPPSGQRRWIVKDLASLNYSVPGELASGADRLRWLTRYLDLRKLDDSARRLIYRIVGKTRRIASHDANRAARFERERRA